MSIVRIQTQDFDTGQLHAQLQESGAGQAGALVSFIGYVRDHASDQQTSSLYLEHYPGMCEREIADLCAHAKQRWDILDTLVVHRVGELKLVEQIVFVGVTSVHRGQAFQACEFIMDALKTRAPFWKRETLKNGQQFWVEQRASDVQKTTDWMQRN